MLFRYKYRMDFVIFIYVDRTFDICLKMHKLAAFVARKLIAPIAKANITKVLIASEYKWIYVDR